MSMTPDERREWMLRLGFQFTVDTGAAKWVRIQARNSTHSGVQWLEVQP
jgi:hypothetical protein